MGQMREIIDLASFARAVIALCALLSVAGLVTGLVTRRARMGIAVGLPGPLIYALWCGYSYLVRYDPATGYCGLHRTSVLLINVVAFGLVGVGLGLLYRWLFRGPAANAPAPEDDTAGAGARQVDGAAERP